MFTYTAFLQYVGRKLFAFIVLLAISPLSHAQTFTQKQIRGDIDYLVRTLKKIHPNLYAHKTKKEFANVVVAVRNNVLKESKRNSALASIQLILAAVCDEHTQIDIKHTLKSLQLVDYKLLLKNEKLLVEFLRLQFMGEYLTLMPSNAFLDNPAIAFNRQTLFRINGHGAAKIQKFARSLVIADGCADSHVLLTRLLPIMHRITFSTLLNITGNYQIAARSHDDDAIRNYSGAAKSLSSLTYQNTRQTAIVSKNAYLKKHGIKLFTSKFQIQNIKDIPGILVRSNPDKSIYYVYSPSFNFGKQQIKITNKLLRKMIANKPKHVIVDLTDNPGGKLRIASHFLSYFLNKSHGVASNVRMRSISTKMPREFKYLNKKRRKAHRIVTRQFRRGRKKNGQYFLPYRKTAFGNPDYKGQLSVLVSPQTHSAGTVVASVLKRLRNAKMVGFLNAGSTKTSCFAADGHYILPNTKISVMIPDTCFDRPKNRSQSGDLLKLNIEVDPLASSSALLSSRILKAALDDIANNTDQHQ